MIEIKNVGISYGKNKIFEQFSLRLKMVTFYVFMEKAGVAKQLY